MHVVIGGDFKNPVLFSTKDAQSMLIDTEDGEPAVLFKFLPSRNGYIRLTRGEDKNFDEVVRQLGLK
jgi:hypothetical protein